MEPEEERFWLRQDIEIGEDLGLGPPLQDALVEEVDQRVMPGPAQPTAPKGLTQIPF